MIVCIVMDETKTLIVRRLPSSLQTADQQDLLRHFGAKHVRCMGSSGQLKNVAFATFESRDEAEVALHRLHQLEILGSRLVAEFSSNSHLHPNELPPVKNSDKSVASEQSSNQVDKTESLLTEKDRKKNIVDRLHMISPKFEVNYPIDTRLQYLYPAPNMTILTNIANAMASVPRFYVQVLHLMNKMNLPAPFSLPTLTPPVPLGVHQPDIPAPPPLPEEDMDVTGSESEIESDDEDSKQMASNSNRKRVSRRRHATRKRLRLQIQMQSQMQSVMDVLPARQSVEQQPCDVFEQPSSITNKKIEIKKISDTSTGAAELPSSDNNTGTGKTGLDGKTNPVTEGFGKMEPVSAPENVQDVEPDDDWVNQGCIDQETLENGRLSVDEINKLDVFRNYDPGEPNSRLYVKNLAKKVTEKDLRFIFSRYINTNNELEKNMFYVQLLTGRMKGQAFITLPSEAVAQKALKETNGYQMHGKALVVQFARSVKPKGKDTS